MWYALAAILVIVLAAIWELYVCEGAHLGRRTVVWTYNLAARRYEHIKQFDLAWETRFLGEPIATIFNSISGTRLLDVGAGTGRLAVALKEAGTFEGTLVAVEPSVGMTAIGRQVQAPFPVGWVRAWSTPLPIADDSFDLVASLEVLEFTPDPGHTIREMVRVLRPGGWLLTTNRIGWQARWIVGHTFRRRNLESLLEGLGLVDIQIFPWQMDYDLVWGFKPSQ